MNYKKIYVIYDTQEDCFVSYNNKAAWTKESNAKLAFTNHQGGWKGKSYSEQKRYIVLPVTVDEVR